MHRIRRRHKYAALGLTSLVPIFYFLFGKVPTQITPKNTTIFLTGDIMLGRSVTIESLDKKKNPNYPFEKVANVMSASDITFSNLENPIVANCPRTSSGFKFCAPPQMLTGLNTAGVDIVTLANNHSENYGQAGLEETADYLKSAGIDYTGVGELRVIEKNGLKFGFLGFDKAQLGTPALTAEEEQLVRESDKKADVLIVAMHWGVEYRAEALTGQEKLAQSLVDLGADVVVGHHPHWVENSEYIAGKPVFYSLGNFIFDQMWSEETRKGLAVRLTYDPKGNLIKEEKIPVYMTNWAQPEFVSVENDI